MSSDPSFSSVAMRRMWILNDLFVATEARRQGVAAALIDAARALAMETGAARLVLATASDNRAARSLYERMGWTEDTRFVHYQFEL